MKRYFGRGLIMVVVLAVFTSCSTPVSEQVAGTVLVEPTHPYTNRLIFEKSPYLLQHAHNPIDWYPWGDKAFEAAGEENKPIFLSIGYSTCHWCHVMEEESFENEEIAALLNEHFIAIKVDREERPDIDSYFMTVSQIITGRGGWPLNVIMTPEKEPFFAATYIPPASVQGRIGMIDLLPAVTAAWQDRSGDVLATATSVMDALESVVTADLTGAGLSETANRSGFENFSGSYDPEYGGFGGAQKFPATHNLLFLLRYWNRTGDDAARLMAETTLTNMRLGGIFDHVGFGFHRYSTDRSWHLPHFEKMLYDQAMLSAGYVEGYLATGDILFRQTAEEIFTYVLRDMLSPEGGFYSAEDADSEGEEGLFYLWSRGDVEELLGTDAEATVAAFGITSGGNYIDEALGTKTSLNVLARTSAPLPQQWEAVRGKLFAHREGRIRPLLDDKILTDWNGLMISSLANGSRAFGDPELLLAAKRAADFIIENMMGAGGELFHRYREGEASIPGQLADYGFFVHGLIDLYQASRDVRYLEYSVSLTDTMLELFLDREAGGFYMTSGESGDLRFRQKKSADGALPSGNSVAFGVLLRLSWLTGNTGYSDHAADTGRAFSKFLEQAPDGHGMLLAFHELLLMEPVEVLVVGKPDAPETIAMLAALDRIYAPNMTVIFRPASETASPLDRVAPFTSGYAMINDTATAYVCRDFVCNLPTTNIGQMLGQIREGLETS